MKRYCTRSIHFIFMAIVVLLIMAKSSPCSADAGVSSARPSRGGPGTIVTFYGKGLGMFADENQVLFGSASARIISWEDNRVQAVVPGEVKMEDLLEKGRRGKLVVPVVFITGDGEKTQGPAFDILPDIAKISPRQGGPGTEVEITGSNFGDYADLGNILTGDKPARILHWRDNRIRFVMPDAFDSGDILMEKDRRGKEKPYLNIRVSVGNLISDGNPFYLETRLTSFWPEHPSPGQQVTLKGQGFGNRVESVKVNAGGLTINPRRADDNNVEFIIPDNITDKNLEQGSLPVRIQTAGITTGKVLIPLAPAVRSIHPGSGGGDRIKLAGSGFGSQNQGKVQIICDDKTHQGIIKSWSPREIVFDFPPAIKSSAGDIKCRVLVKVSSLESDPVNYSFKAPAKPKATPEEEPSKSHQTNEDN